jgi:Gly-Xaa carboxypeptidase
MKPQPKLDFDYLPVSTSLDSKQEGSRKSKFKHLFRLLALVGIVGSVWVTAFGGNCHNKDVGPTFLQSEPNQATCVQADALIPEKHGDLWTNLSSTIRSNNFKLKAVDWLSRAVQIPWVVYTRPPHTVIDGSVEQSLGMQWIPLELIRDGRYSYHSKSI